LAQGSSSLLVGRTLVAGQLLKDTLILNLSFEWL